ncbi:hypothetical protein ABC719_004716, partial [Shigella sonnei]|nr:hypothetical protein [Escherichia coli]EKO8145443.1 hypothetical protein [Escherichia coli]
KAASSGFKAPSPQTISCQVRFNAALKTAYGKIDSDGQVWTRWVTTYGSTSWQKGSYIDNTYTIKGFGNLTVSIWGITGYSVSGEKEVTCTAQWKW